MVSSRAWVAQAVEWVAFLAEEEVEAVEEMQEVWI
jgi:hypothetical protein